MATDMLHSSFERSKPSHRPVMRGREGMVASGHPLATLAALRLLERGGNAVDAGVAAGICLGVLQSDMVNFGGVAPILVYPADEKKVWAVSGLGRWPATASVQLFRERCEGVIPPGILRSITPGAPDAWVTTLLRFGTFSFEDVARDAIDLAEHGFPMHHFMANNLREEEESYRQFPGNVEVYFSKGRPPEVGEVFRQPALAETLKLMVAAERKHRFSGRETALLAARDVFYKGEIAEAIADFHAREDGLVTREDLAAFQVGVETPRWVDHHGLRVYTCGPWCQGPTLLEALNLLEGYDLPALGHNTPAYVHTLTEAFKLAFADREAFIGDPDFVKVPLAGLISKTYARARREAIDPAKAWPEMPPPGDPFAFATGAGAPKIGAGGGGGSAMFTHHGGRDFHGLEGPHGHRDPFSGNDPFGLGDRWDTSYVAVMDRWGNAFSATPSDSPAQAPIIPQLGILCSSRGSQSWVDENHPSSVAGGKRPRLTPTPGLVLKDGKPFMAFGTPGGDVQIQAMAQVLFNIATFGMDPQEAIEAPRFSTYSYPGSFAPHAYNPGLFRAERRIGEEVLQEMAALGNVVEPWEDWSWRGGGICAVLRDEDHGTLLGAADPRRECYAFGW